MGRLALDLDDNSFDNVPMVSTSHPIYTSSSRSRRLQRNNTNSHQDSSNNNGNNSIANDNGISSLSLDHGWPITDEQEAVEQNHYQSERPINQNVIYNSTASNERRSRILSNNNLSNGDQSLAAGSILDTANRSNLTRRQRERSSIANRLNHTTLST